ncbi:MAG: acyl-CoA dehydratase activase [Candidatus Zixiibacteriota bacterium]
MKEKLFLGIDVGSVSVKLVLLSEHKEILYHSYTRSEGQPLKVVKDELEKLLESYNLSQINALAATGSGGKLIAELLGGTPVNEVIAQIKATSFLCPEVRTIIEMGGEDSKLILLEYDDTTKQAVLKDFAMNTICAAGTGSFLDQQAKRLKIDIEDEFGELALKSKNPPRIAGRCSVFAKSDMIHLQQIATPDYDIVAGLCYAMARNFKSNIAKGKKINPPVSFQGGVAFNLGLRKAFKDIFELDDLIIPPYHAELGALGSALHILEDQKDLKKFKGLDGLIRYFESEGPERETQEKLTYDYPQNKYYRLVSSLSPEEACPQKIDAFLGIDVGSLSTNVVVIDENKNVLSRRYLMTEGRPIEAVRRGLEEVGNEVKDRVVIKAAGTTGSGRYLTGDFVGADIIRNEITAQAIAAIEIDPRVDTIFEIGGQDSKFISLENGAVVDFEMNKVCAAGTGSFLQEQAEKLNIKIEEEFGNLALKAESPVNCGERCTVFMESDLVSHQQSGAKKEDLVAGLAYSIVYNYLNKVVGDKKIGNHVFFQGGVAWNKGVVAAFEKVLGKRITVPPHHDVTGAIGVAILAMQSWDGKPSGFKGFDLSKKRYQLSTFECQDCPNHCEIKKVEMENQPSLYYGSRCEKYDVKKKKKIPRNLPDLFKQRERILFTIHKDFSPSRKDKGKKIGIPRALFFHEYFPFWASFFENLGFEVVLSDPTNKKIIREGTEKVSFETCFPLKVAFGHILNLVQKDVDFIFLPSLINLKKEDYDYHQSYACPYVQALPYMVKASFTFEKDNTKLLTIPVHFQWGKKLILKELGRLKKTLKVSGKKIESAYQVAERCQERFYSELQRIGSEIIPDLKDNQKALVIVGRPYNTCDPLISLDLAKKFRELGVLSIPLDLLPVDSTLSGKKICNMYWKYGQRILSGANFINKNLNLYPVYVTNFGCGPDSFIVHFFRKLLGDKPLLLLELDEHSADAGIITRCEAFQDSLKNFRPEAKRKPIPQFPAHSGDNRTVFIPNMTDHAYALKAAFIACGIKAEVMPESNQNTLRLGRKYTSGKECYPCILTTGDMIKKLESKNFEPKKSAFFMPTANGPCRFGQYHNLHRIILDELGYNHVPIYSPDSKDSYSNVVNLDGDFRRLAWHGILAVDLLQKLLWQIRPYEQDKGQTDRIYWNYISGLQDFIVKGKDVGQLLTSAKEDFKRIKVDKSEKRPVIGVVGEIYIRCNRFANNNLVEKIEKLGGEAKVAPMAEWFLYTTYRYKEESLIDKKIKDYLKALIKDWVQRKDEKRLIKKLEDGFQDLHDFTVEQIMKLSCFYLDKTFGTEAILSVGKSLEYIQKGFSGIVNTMPFGCMPGTIVSALSAKIREDFYNVPWLDIAYEGLEETNELTRLEAFIHQAKQYHRRKLNSMGS